MNKIKLIKILVIALVAPFIAYFVLLLIVLIDVFFIDKEFGLGISFYKSKACAEKESTYKDCFLFMDAVGTNLFNPTSLEKGLNDAINREVIEHGEEILQNYPKNPSDWVCALNGRIIEDNKKEKRRFLLAQQIRYNCWPAEKSQ